MAARRVERAAVDAQAHAAQELDLQAGRQHDDVGRQLLAGLQQDAARR
jgi:hypothetical protein